MEMTTKAYAFVVIPIFVFFFASDNALFLGYRSNSLPTKGKGSKALRPCL